MTSRTKVVKVTEWNDILRENRTLRTQLRDLGQRVELLDATVQVLSQTIMVPRGKTLGK